MVYDDAPLVRKMENIFLALRFLFRHISICSSMVNFNNCYKKNVVP